MTPIRRLDLVKLRHTPDWIAQVLLTDEDIPSALIEYGVSTSCCIAWVPLEVLELVPGQMEQLAA